MRNEHVAVLAFAAVLLAAGFASAENEGNGDPFAFEAGSQPQAVNSVRSDAGQNLYPAPVGSVSHLSILARAVLSSGAEASVETANSLPPNAGGGSAGYAQASGIGRDLAAGKPSGPYLEAGSTQRAR